MGLWNKLFSRTRRIHGDARNQMRDNTAQHIAGCPFCGAGEVECDRSAPYLYPVWRCACGALASGAIVPDLDEVADQLLEILRINVRLSNPCIPTEHPMISMQRYDIPKLERDMPEVLARHGYEFRIAPGDGPNERRYWIRKNV